jgi:hypothetical protein
LTVVETSHVAGGDSDSLDEVVVSASRLTPQSLDLQSLQDYLDRQMGLQHWYLYGGGGGGGDGSFVIEHTAEWVAKWLFETRILINDREEKANPDMSKLEKKIVDGHAHYYDKETKTFWIDMDKDGKLDSQYKEVDGRLYLNVTGGGAWYLVPDRADWRNGYWLDINGKYGRPPGT